jgi:predicted O-linked N-acetylglucosamine transferase (SPINDLY family)
LALRRDDVKILVARSNTLLDMDRGEEALEGLNKAVAIKPQDAMARYNRGNVLSGLQRYEEAAESYEGALAIEPNHRYASSGLADCALFICDWRRTEALAGQLQARARDRTAIVHPFTFLSYCGDPSLLLACARSLVDDKLAVAPSTPHAAPRRHERVRIAYVSADFRRHAMSHLIGDLLARHDRSRFEVHGVSLGPDDGSDTRAGIIKALDRFHDVPTKGDGEIADLMRALEIDIAVDLNGQTRGGRMGIFARRPAPVQVSYLGFPGTTGADFFDYLIADDIVVPQGEDDFHAEKIVRLPVCYRVDNATRRMAESTPTRGAAGLPDRGFVFCCFNNNYTIAPAVFDAWMRLLHAVEGSVLWLLRDNAAAERNLRREAAARGVDPARLVFADRVSIDEHLARHRLADLFLDTLPVNAQTTATDALWAELPLVTCRGTTFAGRVGASVLHAVGLPELVTDSLAAYEALALRLAGDAALLQSLRTRLAHNKLHGPLFDTDHFRRRLEAAFATMWERCQRGEPPRSFDVAL